MQRLRFCWGSVIWRVCVALTLAAAAAKEASTDAVVEELAPFASHRREHEDVSWTLLFSSCGAKWEAPAWAVHATAAASWFLTESPLELAVAASRQLARIASSQPHVGNSAGHKPTVEVGEGGAADQSIAAAALTAATPVLLLEAGALRKTSTPLAVVAQVFASFVVVCIVGGILLEHCLGSDIEADAAPSIRQVRLQDPQPPRNLWSPATARQGKYPDTQQSLRPLQTVRNAPVETSKAASSITLPPPPDTAANMPMDVVKPSDDKLCPNLNVPSLGGKLAFSVSVADLRRLASSDVLNPIDILGPSGSRLFFARLIPGEVAGADVDGASAGPWLGVSTSPKTMFLHARIGPLPLQPHGFGAASASTPLLIRNTPSSGSANWSGSMEHRNGEWQVRKDGEDGRILLAISGVALQNSGILRDDLRGQVESRRRLLCGYNGWSVPVAWADIVRNVPVQGNEMLRVQVAERSDYMLSLITMMTAVILYPNVMDAPPAQNGAPARQAPTASSPPGTADDAARPQPPSMQWRSRQP